MDFELVRTTDYNLLDLSKRKLHRESKESFSSHINQGLDLRLQEFLKFKNVARLIFSQCFYRNMVESCERTCSTHLLGRPTTNDVGDTNDGQFPTSGSIEGHQIVLFHRDAKHRTLRS
jgi:hypothetical protein